MTDRSAQVTFQPVLTAEIEGRRDSAYARVRTTPFPALWPDDTSALNPAAEIHAARLATGNPQVEAATVRPAREDLQQNGWDWFEHPHVIARSYAFGNVLTTQTTALVVFNAYRRDELAWSAFANGAGVGVSLLGQPSLPYVLPPLTELAMTLEVLTTGTPQVNSTLDFTFGDGSFLDIPISLTRLVLLAYLPESGYEEQLDFLTNVLIHRTGTEQRNSLRKRPRQLFAVEFRLLEGAELQRFDNILFDWHDRLFGFPVWHDQMTLAAAASAGATTITVDSTANLDLRVDSLCMIRTNESTFDVLEVASFTTTTITFKAPLIGSYSAGAIVAPVRLTRILDQSIRGSRTPKGYAVRRLALEVQDNDVDLASTAGFSSLNSKVLLTEGNVIRGVMTEAFDRPITVIDNETGAVTQIATQTRDRRSSTKTFFTAGRAQRWTTRRLMYALDGRRVSFYLPTFYEDLTLAADLTSGSNAMSVVNVGYARYVRTRSPWTIIRILFNNGNSPLIRTIQTAVETSSAVDTLTVDTVWGSNIPRSTVSRIEFIELVRFDSDTIRILHEPGFRVSKFTAPVRGVFE